MMIPLSQARRRRVKAVWRQRETTGLPYHANEQGQGSGGQPTKLPHCEEPPRRTLQERLVYKASSGGAEAPCSFQCFQCFQCFRERQMACAHIDSRSMLSVPVTSSS